MRLSTRIANSLIGAAAAALLALSAHAAESNAPAAAPAAGSAAFNNNCRTCHSAKEGDNRLGPSLAKIVGAKAGTRSGYPNYSQAMKNSGVTWDEATLDRFIANPEDVVPNNNMKPFKGVTDAAVRKSIIESLKKD